MLTEQEIMIIQAKVKLECATEKLSVAMVKRQVLLDAEDNKCQQAKVQIGKDYQSEIDNLTAQKEQAEINYKGLLTEEK